MNPPPAQPSRKSRQSEHHARTLNTKTPPGTRPAGSSHPTTSSTRTRRSCSSSAPSGKYIGETPSRFEARIGHARARRRRVRRTLATGGTPPTRPSRSPGAGCPAPARTSTCTPTMRKAVRADSASPAVRRRTSATAKNTHTTLTYSPASVPVAATRSPSPSDSPPLRPGSSLDRRRRPLPKGSSRNNLYGLGAGPFVGCFFGCTV
jgi:hypothetical protein